MNMGKLLSSFGFLFFERIYRILGAFFIGVLVARTYGPESYGGVALGLSIVGGVTSILSSSYKSVYIKEHFTSNGSSIGLHALVVHQVILSFFFFITFFLLLIFSRGNNNELYLILSMFSLAIGINSFGVYRWLYEAEGKFQSVVKIDFFAFLISSIVKLVACVGNLAIHFVIIGFLSEYIILAVGYFFLLRGRKLADCFALSWKEIWMPVRRCKMLLMAGICSVLYVRAIGYLVSLLLGMEEYGNYAVVTRIVELWNMFSVVLMTLAQPRISKIEPEKRNEYLVAYICLTLYSTFLFCAFLLLFGKYFVLLLFGDSYLAASEFVGIYSLSLLPTSLGYVWAFWLVLNERHNVILINQLLSALIVLPIGYILINFYGLSGAIYGGIFGFSAAAIMSYALWKPISWFKMLFYAAVLPISKMVCSNMFFCGNKKR